MMLVVTTNKEQPLDGDPDLKDNDDVYDPQSVLCDTLEEQGNNSHLTEWNRCKEEKRQILGKEVTISDCNSSQTWKVRGDTPSSECADVEAAEEQEVVGIHKFSFSNEEIRTNNGRRISFLKLIIKLWPGDWRVQLAQVNRLIRSDNEKKRKRSRTGKVKLTKEITKQEFWVFWGIKAKVQQKLHRYN